MCFFLFSDMIEKDDKCINLKFVYLVPNVDLPPLCSSRFRPGPPGEQAQVLSQFVADVISKWVPEHGEGEIWNLLFLCYHFHGNKF